MIKQITACLYLAVAICFGGFGTCSAQPEDCPQFFANGLMPSAHAAAEKDFCFLAFADGYSTDWREPIWSAEHITTASAQLALANPRIGSFHVCPELDADERSGSSDYAKSGYDQGHMTPVGDFGDPDLEKDTFRYCNMVPQRPQLNRLVWAGIENGVLNWAVSGGDVFVVTGPIVPSAPERTGRVAIPSHTWKAVYSPKSGSGAYLCSNIKTPVCTHESVAALAAQIGFDPFPGVAVETKMLEAALPLPTKGRLAN